MGKFGSFGGGSKISFTPSSTALTKSIPNAKKAVSQLTEGTKNLYDPKQSAFQNVKDDVLSTVSNIKNMGPSIKEKFGTFTMEIGSVLDPYELLATITDNMPTIISYGSMLHDLFAHNNSKPLDNSLVEAIITEVRTEPLHSREKIINDTIKKVEVAINKAPYKIPQVHEYKWREKGEASYITPSGFYVTFY